MFYLIKVYHIQPIGSLKHFKGSYEVFQDAEKIRNHYAYLPAHKASCVLLEQAPHILNLVMKNSVCTVVM